jgi:alpha-mannosidase
MSISLLRSPQAPDPTADRGKHSFSYSFFVEEGSVKGLEKAIDDGYRVFNPPVRVRTSASVPFSVKTYKGKVVLETVKISEKEDGIILRFYEALGSVGRISIITEYPVYECDMTEENFSKLDKERSLTFKPFQVRTFLLKKE